MYFVFGFVLLSTMALTSPMLDEIMGYPAGHHRLSSTIPCGIGLVAGFLLMGRAPKLDRHTGVHHCRYGAGGLRQLADARLLAVDGLDTPWRGADSFKVSASAC
jgi:hypothetical protein